MANVVYISSTHNRAFINIWEGLVLICLEEIKLSEWNVFVNFTAQRMKWLLHVEMALKHVMKLKTFKSNGIERGVMTWSQE